MKTLKQILEDGVPMNNVGSGHIAGTGIGPQGEPGGQKSLMLKKKKIEQILSRKNPNS